MSVALNAGPQSVPRTPRRASGDRFIPSSISRTSLVLGRHPERLTPREKLSRTLSSGPDPFGSAVPRTPVPRRAGSSPPSPGRGVTLNGIRRSLSTSPSGRPLSQGAVWGIGGGAAAIGESVAGVPNGRGGLLASGTNAPLYSSNFLARRDSTAELDTHERRLAMALELDTASRVLRYSTPPLTPDSGYSSSPERRLPLTPLQRVWRDNQWERADSPQCRSDALWSANGFSLLTCHSTNQEETEEEGRACDSLQMVLDAPSLRDDYYCSLLAYSPTVESLAVGLGSHVYLWTESKNATTPESLRTSHTAHVTSLSFSSTSGERGILAVGRADGRLLLWSPKEQEARWDVVQPNSVCCVAFRPEPMKRPSIRDPHIDVETEELLVGDEAGHLYYYSVEWPTADEKDLWDWPGAMTLLLRITAHSQQICGIAWSPDCEFFATGGNDNFCYLFETKKVVHRASATSDPTSSAQARRALYNSNGSSTHIPLSSNPSFTLSSLMAKHTFTLQAAVKAISFCPWQRGLLALGGGSNDRCIHFYHTLSGACLGKIDCCAQVTSLIWSKTRREIAATFGFAQPEHPYRIAVFAWPSCRQVVAIPWFDEHRALYAISYPGGPNTGCPGRGDEGGRWWSRTQEEGCIVVATSDCSIKFHEIWAEEKHSGGRGGCGNVATKGGLLGGSDILESLHGIDKDGKDVIR